MHELYDINISDSNVESALGYNQSNADGLMRQIYEKLPSSEAVVVWNVRRGALAAVLDLVKTALAIQDLKNTLDTLPFAVVAEVMGIEVPGLSLEKVDDLRNMAYGAVAALQDPPRVLAALGQKIGDTVEEEGIAYSISYVAADVAIQVLLSKGLGEVKNVSKADDLVDVARTVDTLNDTVKIADELTDAAKAVDQVGDIKDVAMAVNVVDETNAVVKAVDEVNDVADAAKTIEKLDGVIEGGTLTAQKVFTDNPFDEAGNLRSNIKYQTGEFKYNYETDANGRISNWNTDNLQLTERDGRLNYNSNSPGKIEGDHAGHLAGDRFGGSPELDNIVSQSQNVNLSQYKKIENQWAKAISEGKEVTVNVDIKYDGDGLRPIEFNVEYTIDGDFFSQSILN